MYGWQQVVKTDASISDCTPCSPRPSGNSVSDIGATDQWRQKLTQLRNLGIEASIFNYLEEVATDNERTAGLDIADYLLQIEPDQQCCKL